MMKGRNIYKSIILLLTSISLFTILATPTSALNCSFTYSSRGSCIHLVPTLSGDVAYYRWSIERTNGTANIGVTLWIPGNKSFIQMFALDYASEYHIILEAKDASGTSITFARFIHTSASSLSVQEGLAITEETQEALGRINLVDYIMTYFNSLSIASKTLFASGALAFLFLVIYLIFNVPIRKRLK